MWRLDLNVLNGILCKGVADVVMSEVSSHRHTDSKVGQGLNAFLRDHATNAHP
jgi:hypothetical protein